MCAKNRVNIFDHFQDIRENVEWPVFIGPPGILEVKFIRWSALENLCPRWCFFKWRRCWCGCGWWWWWWWNTHRLQPCILGIESNLQRDRAVSSTIARLSCNNYLTAVFRARPPEFPFGNSRKFPGIRHFKNSRREFPGISEFWAKNSDSS